MPNHDSPHRGASEDVLIDNDRQEFREARLKEMMDVGISREDAEMIDIQVRQTSEAVMRLIADDTNAFVKHVGKDKPLVPLFMHMNVLEMVAGSCEGSKSALAQHILAQHMGLSGIKVLRLDDPAAIDAFLRGLFGE